MPKRTKKTEEATVTELKPKVAKQGELTGIEAPNHPELDTLLEEHFAQSTLLGETRQSIGALNAQLEDKATELGLKTYRHPTATPSLILKISAGKTKVSVIRAKSEAPADDAETDE